MTKNRHAELGLTNEDVLKMFETMLMARRIDERYVVIKPRWENSICYFLSRTRSSTSRSSFCSR